MCDDLDRQADSMRLDLIFTLMRMKAAAERPPSDLAARWEKIMADHRANMRRFWHDPARSGGP